jgi:hypothetical protein
MTHRSFPADAARALPEGYLLARWFTAARRQGMLAAVPPEAWHTLCALLSFTGRDGRRCFSARTVPVSGGGTDPAGIAAISRERWSRPRAEVELEIADFWEGREKWEPRLD